MHVRDASFINYCRAKKATKKLKIHGEYKVLRIEVKTKTKQTKKILPGFIRKKYNKKQIYQKLGKPFSLLSKWEEKVNVLRAP